MYVIQPFGRSTNKRSFIHSFIHVSIIKNTVSDNNKRNAKKYSLPPSSWEIKSQQRYAMGVMLQCL